MTDFERARQQMVESQLMTSNVTDRRLLGVMARLPRQRFVPDPWQALAYIDRDIPLGPFRVLRAPAPFARLVQLAGVTQSDRVLDVGCGMGYSAAVLASLATHVTATEVDPAMARQSRDALTTLGLDATIIAAAEPPRSQGQFDVIILEEAVEAVPPSLLALLADGGRLVAPITGRANAVAHLFVRSGSEVAGRPDFDMTLPAAAPAETDDFVF